MRGFSTELKVGFFALMVLALLSFMTFKVGGFEWAKPKGNTLYVNFRNTAGLDEKTRVRIAGVDAGTIERIDLVSGTGRVKLQMKPGVRLYRDAKASIRSSGLLGDKYLAIDIGSETQPLLRSGETITNVAELVDVDDLVRKLVDVSAHITRLSDSLNDVFGTDEAKASMRQTINNISEISAALSRTIDQNDARLTSVLDNINSLTASLNGLINDNREPIRTTVANMREFSGSLRTSGPELVENLNKATQELRGLVEENRPAVKNVVTNMDNITQRIDRGEGFLGKLVKDEKLYDSMNTAVEGVNKTISAVDRFRTFISFQADYLTRQRDAKGAFYVTLQPRPDKYYIIGVVGSPLGRVETTDTITTTGGVQTVTREEEIRKNVTFTAQFAKRFGNAAMRIGVTESTFGVGADYFFNDDKGRLTADVWDFGKDERDATNPHVRVGLEYYLFKRMFVGAGVDNVLNKKTRGAYVGTGLRFEDEDFKYLFGSLPRIPGK